MTTVIATDGSDLATRALDAGLALARATGDTVVLVTAWQIPIGDFGLPYSSIATPDLIDAEREVAEKTLATAADRARAAGVGVETELREGGAAHEICSVASERNARMIVIGSHGWGALRSALYGSVAGGVLRHAPCPVLLVPGSGAEKPGDDAG
jgi:nucleotide-binding universal stress UspA family protein